LRSLAKNPAERFTSAEEFQQTLFRVKPIKVKPVKVQPVRTLRQKSPTVRRAWLIGTAAGFAVISLAVAGVLHTRQSPKPNNVPAALVVSRPAEQATNQPTTTDVLPEPTELQPQVDDLQPKKPASKPRITAGNAHGPVSPPSPATSGPGSQPVEESPVLQAIEAPPPVPAEEQLASQSAGQSTSAKAETAGGTPKPSQNGLKKGLGKLWHLVKHNKSTTEDDTPLRPSEHQ